MSASSPDLAFLKGFLARPWRVASPVPSGRKLARRIAEEIDPAARGLVVELGPGTGAVTRALLERGVAEDDLVLVETDPDFVALLRKAFPRARIIEADAFAFADRLYAHGVRGVVSGLPVTNETEARRKDLLASAIALLAPGRPFVQFTYSSRLPLPAIEGVCVHRAATVWENIWPMRIWTYRLPIKDLAIPARAGTPMFES